MIFDKLNGQWRELLDDELEQEYISSLSQFVTEEYQTQTIYPPQAEIFAALELCTPMQTKVVILGQDPYHQYGQAHGLSFSVEDGIKPPRSLCNIFKEIERDLGIRPSQSGNLKRWAVQGVLLLNATLTVRDSSAGSHQRRGWEQFTDSMISKISKHNNNVVFLLWGSYAISKSKLIDQSKHLVLSSAHPSPLSAHRGFLGNGHFSKCNEYLTEKGIEPIEW